MEPFSVLKNINSSLQEYHKEYHYCFLNLCPILTAWRQKHKHWNVSALSIRFVLINILCLGWDHGKLESFLQFPAGNLNCGLSVTMFISTPMKSTELLVNFGDLFWPVRKNLEKCYHLCDWFWFIFTNIIQICYYKVIVQWFFIAVILWHFFLSCFWSLYRWNLLCHQFVDKINK